MIREEFKITMTDTWNNIVDKVDCICKAWGISTER
jgi:hypothetical protein